MCEKLSDRKHRESEAIQGAGITKVSDTELLSKAGNLIKVVKRGD